jgi:hypothetical protein
MSEESVALIPKPHDGHGKKPTKWTKDHEKILIDWADKAMCYRWLHAKSNSKLSKINTFFTIPVIIMSTITGTANFASERVPEEYRSLFSMAVGGINIFAGIITTIQQFLKISETNEAHRVSSISWDKFYRKIRVELAKPPAERQNVYDFLKTCTEEFDRLMETSPNISKPIVSLFNKTFNGDHLSEEQRKMFKALKKPEICDSLESVQFSMFKEDEKQKRQNVFRGLLEEVADKTKKVSKEYRESMKMKVIDEFVVNFREEMFRAPSKDDLMNNLNNEIFDIGENEIDMYMNKYPEKFVNTNDEPSDMLDIDDIESGVSEAFQNVFMSRTSDGIELTSTQSS